MPGANYLRFRLHGLEDVILVLIVPVKMLLIKNYGTQTQSSRQCD